MDIKQLIYASQPFGFDGATLAGILLDARRCNNRDGITGALVCRHDVYLQLLEGPQDAVTVAFARISRDDRHANVTEMSNTMVDARLFGDWDMLHDPAKSWLWSIEDVADGALGRVTPEDARVVFADLAGKVANGTAHQG